MPKHLLWCEEMFRLDINGFPEQPRLDTQKRQPIVKLATDLADELAHRPALAPRQHLVSIKGARDNCLHEEQPYKGGPWQGKSLRDGASLGRVPRRCSRKGPAGKNCRQRRHNREGSRFCRQRLQNLFGRPKVAVSAHRSPRSHIRRIQPDVQVAQRLATLHEFVLVALTLKAQDLQ
jgi:hypothetical protein